MYLCSVKTGEMYPDVNPDDGAPLTFNCLPFLLADEERPRCTSV